MMAQLFAAISICYTQTTVTFSAAATFGGPGKRILLSGSFSYPRVALTDSFPKSHFRSQRVDYD